MRTHTKTIEATDYSDLSPQITMLKKAANALSAAGCFIDGLTDMRLWEYGLASKSLMEWILKQPLTKLPDLKMVDFGAGDGLLGPALSMMTKHSITEIEPRSSCLANRVKINTFLVEHNHHRISLAGTRHPGEKWDVVFCTSVVEHVLEQDAFWSTLVDAVAPGGLLFVTTDVVPDPSKSYQFDNLRVVNYTTELLAHRCEWILSKGFKWFGGNPDWEYHGDMAYDYSFMSMCLTKERG